MATFIQQSNTNPIGGAGTSAFDEDPTNPNRYRPVNQGGSAYDFRAAGFGQPTSAIPNAGVSTTPEQDAAAGGGGSQPSILNNIQSEDPDAREREGGVQHAQARQEAQVAGGKIDDIANMIDASMTGLSAIPSANPALAVPGAISLANNLATGAFNEPYGNWNTLPGFEEAVLARLKAGAGSVTEAQNAEAAARAAKGQTPEGYKPGSNAEVDTAYGGWRETQPYADPTALREANLDQISKLTDAPAPTATPAAPAATPNPNASSNGGGGGGAGGNAGDRGPGRGGADPGKGGEHSRGDMGGSGRRALASGGHISRYQAGGSVLDEVGASDAPPAPMPMPMRIPSTPAAQALTPSQQQERFAPAPSQIADDGIVDNQPIMADEGEYMINRESAQILGPELLNLLNDPNMAKTIRDMMDTMIDDDDGDEMGAEADVGPIDSDFDGEPQGLYAIQ